ncbi:accessory gene regulator B family protein [Oscillospiraceae bacterium 42-9]
MIKRIAAVTAKWLLQAGAISASDVELYEYSIYSFLFTLCPLGLVLIISVFLHMVVEGILLIIPFILIRKFCGGFHFQSSVLCGIVSTLVLTAFLLGIRLVLDTSAYGWWCVMLLLAAVQTIVFSPIDSEGRRLTQNEKKVFKKITIVLSMITIAICAVLTGFHQTWAAVSVGSGLILSAALQFPCLFLKNRYHEGEGQ